MNSIYELLNPSTIGGAIICSVIGGVILVVGTWAVKKDKKDKKDKKGSKSNIKSRIHIGNDNNGDVNVGSTVSKNIKIENFYGVDESRFLDMNLQVVEKLNDLSKEISKFSSVEDRNLNALIELLAGRVKSRIDYLSRIDLTNWIYDENAFNKRDVLLKQLMLLDQNSETQIREIVFEIGKGASAIEILFNEYIELEKAQINFLFNNILRDSVSIFIETGMDYQNLIRTTIAKVIEKYNQNIEFITNAFLVKKNNTIPNKYRKINERIYYSDIQERNQKIQKTIETIRSSGDCGSINIIQNSKEKIPIELIPQEIQAPVLNGDQMSSEVISFLEAVYESIDKNAFIQFNPHSQKNHVLFFIKLSIKEMDQLSELQSRSNIAYYFFEKQ